MIGHNTTERVGLAAAATVGRETYCAAIQGMKGATSPLAHILAFSVDRVASAANSLEVDEFE